MKIKNHSTTFIISVFNCLKIKIPVSPVPVPILSIYQYGNFLEDDTYTNMFTKIAVIVTTEGRRNRRRFA